MGPDRPTYGLTKNAGTALLQQIAKDTSPDVMQAVSFHPGGVLTETARKAGYKEGDVDFDDGEFAKYLEKIALLEFHDHHNLLTLAGSPENLPGNFAVWAASPEATFLHGRFVWANWDVEELKNVVGSRISKDEHFLKVGVEGLSEKDGGVKF